MADVALTRAEFLRAVAAGAAALALARSGEAAAAQASKPELTLEDLKAFLKLADLRMSDAELQQVLQAGAAESVAEYAGLRKFVDSYDLVPRETFRPVGIERLKPGRVAVRTRPVRLRRPSGDEDLAYLGVTELGHLLRTRQVSSVELTELALRRLRRYGPGLRCLVTLMEERALRQARERDEELKSGRVRGPLHGIPTGIKDLFATKGYPTQWGTEAFRGQTLDYDAAVVERLDRAGAVIVAKLSLGALAMDNKWFGGETLNPWNPKEGSSGSSAGSAAAVAAGLVPFAIGTETSGSIVSPSLRCRVSGLRSTFGSVSRHGAMALSWTMDKIGPICRTIEDAAVVLAALLGPDPRDLSTVARPFEHRPIDRLDGWTLGVVGRPPREALDVLEKAGAKLREAALPEMPPGLGNIIGVESAAMFDEITRNGRLSLVENEWPLYFRSSRFVPAVEYAQAQRARAKLCAQWDEAMEPFDCMVLPDAGGALIYPANLCGLPQAIVPFGTHPDGKSRSVSFLARAYQESKAVAAADVLQRATGFHRLRPDLSPFA
ncbi:MAG: amidase [Fimbriimonadales bacterium]|nr:amidase [Fimbriimonadales bacterium]